jgi:hypothetical protein
MNKLPLLLLSLVTLQLPAQGVDFNRHNSTITPVTAHKSDSDMGPEIIDGVLYFSSLRTESKNDSLRDRFFDLFAIPVNEAQQKNARREIIKPLCSDYHDGPVSFCEATGELFITRSDMANASGKRKNSKHKMVPLKIEVYQKEQDQWVFKEEFPFNVPHYSVGHPAINAAGDTLVYASNQPGGYGSTDLYLAVRKKGVWQKPQNLGPSVNTKRREITPFINTDGTLFFASNGRRGKGGFDIYAVKLSFPVTTRPVDLNRPINTGANDYGLVLHPNQQIGYLVSNRNRGKGNDAIFCLKKNDFTFSQTPADTTLMKEINRKVESSVEETNQYLDKKKAENTEFYTLSYQISDEVTDKSNVPDLKLNFWYTIGNDTLKFGLNTFAMQKYTLENSEAANVLLTTLKNSLENEWKEYLLPGRQIDITVNGEYDAIESANPITYEGEYGDTITGYCLVGDNRETLTVENHSILNNKSLAFLRAYGIQHYLGHEIAPLQKTSNAFHYRLIPKNQLNTGHHWATIEIILHNAFANF